MGNYRAAPGLARARSAGGAAGGWGGVLRPLRTSVCSLGPDPTGRGERRGAGRPGPGAETRERGRQPARPPPPPRPPQLLGARPAAVAARGAARSQAGAPRETWGRPGGRSAGPRGPGVGSRGGPRAVREPLQSTRPPDGAAGLCRSPPSPLPAPHPASWLPKRAGHPPTPSLRTCCPPALAPSWGLLPALRGDGSRGPAMGAPPPVLLRARPGARSSAAALCGFGDVSQPL